MDRSPTSADAASGSAPRRAGFQGHRRLLLVESGASPGTGGRPRCSVLRETMGMRHRQSIYLPDHDAYLLTLVKRATYSAARADATHQGEIHVCQFHSVETELGSPGGVFRLEPCVRIRRLG